MENKRYYVEMEVLTPLAAGAGNESDLICGVDYIQKNGKVYVIDMEKAYRCGADMNKLASAFANADQNAIERIIGNNLERVSVRIFNSPCLTTNAIKSFMRTKLIDKPVVPGSSIKGAIRSALFNQLHGHKRPGEDREKGEDINSKVFGSMDDGSVFTRFIHVGDIVMPETCLVNTKIFNLRQDYRDKEWYGGWKHGMNRTTDDYRPTGFNTLYECVAPSSKGIGIIDMMGHDFETLCNSRVEQSHKAIKEKIMENGITLLFKMINDTTFNYIQNELDFLEKYQADRSVEIEDKLGAILDRIPEGPSDYCIMKMSAGTGFHSITGDWQYEDYIDDPGTDKAGKKKYKSRKIADYNGRLTMMGFVKLRLIEQDGKQAYLNHIEQMKK